MKFKNNSADRFWLLCLISVILVGLYKIGIYIHADPLLYAKLQMLLIFLTCIYLIICFLFYYMGTTKAEREGELELWNIISVISYFIYHTFKSKK